MTASQLSTRARLWTADTSPFIASLLALMTFIAFESFAVTTVLPVAMTDLDGVRWYSFAFAATITTALVGMVIGGNWADRAGPRRPLIVGGTLFLAGLALCIVAPNATTFIVGRLLQGVGGGIDSVIIYVLIARHIPEELRPRMFGLLTTAWLVPSLAGPLVAGALTDVTNWRMVFALILVGTAISLITLLRATRTTEPAHRHVAPRIVGRNGALALLAALLLGALHVGGQFDPPTSTVVIIVALIALIATARGILPRGTLLLRGTPQRLIALRAILGATVAATDLYLTLYLQTERGYPPTAAGLVIAVGAGGWIFGARLQGRFSSGPTDHGRVILPATALVALGPLTVLVYATVGLPLWAVVAGGITMGTGMGIGYPRLSSATLALAGPAEQGSYSSALQAGESLGVAATTALAAVVLASTLAKSVSFIVVYAALVGLACLAIAVATGSISGQRSNGMTPQIG